MKTQYAILGLGQTGYACAVYLLSLGKSFIVIDDRAQPPYLSQLKKTYPKITVHCGALSETLLDSVEEVLEKGEDVRQVVVTHLVGRLEWNRHQDVRVLGTKLFLEFLKFLKHF